MTDSLQKKYYKISEVAEILSIPPSTLRFWESQFTIIKPRRNAHGTRFYTPNDVETIRMVYYLVKEKGLKLEAAQQQIKKNRSGIERKSQAIERLRRIRSTIQNIVDALNERQRCR